MRSAACRGQVAAKSSATAPMPGQDWMTTSLGRRRAASWSRPVVSRSASIPAARHRKKNSSLSELWRTMMSPPGFAPDSMVRPLRELLVALGTPAITRNDAATYA